MPRNPTTKTRRLEGFHASTIKTYQATRNLWEQVVARQLSVEAVQHQVHTLQTRLGALRSESKLLARFQRAYHKLPSTSAGRLITSQHGAALDAMASFVCLLTKHLGAHSMEVVAGTAPPGPNNSCDRERLADLAIQFQALGGLPVLDDASTAVLEAEFGCARTLRRKKSEGRSAVRQRSALRRAMELYDTLDPEIRAICRSAKSVNDKMRLICLLDERARGWSSLDWSRLLKATDSAIRQTVTWKEIRKFCIKLGNQVPLDDRIFDRHWRK